MREREAICQKNQRSLSVSFSITAKSTNDAGSVDAKIGRTALKTGLTPSRNRPQISETTSPPLVTSQMSVTSTGSVERKRWDKSLTNQKFKGQSTMEVDSDVRSTKLFTDLLECQICHQSFTDPRILPCGHSFCKNCIEATFGKESNSEKSKAKLRCPTCDRNMTLAESGIDGLSSDFKVSKLRDILRHISVVEKPPDQDVKCDVCSTAASASVYCTDCNKNMCHDCVTKHNAATIFKAHKAVDCAQVVGTLLCKMHSGEQVKYFCKDCNVVICTICSLQSSHADHTKCSLNEGLSILKTNVKNVVDELEKTVKDLELNKVDVLNRTALVRQTMERTQSRVTSRAEQLRINIQQLETALCEKLDAAKQELERNENELQSQHRFKGASCAKLLQDGLQSIRNHLNSASIELAQNSGAQKKEQELREEEMRARLDLAQAAQRAHLSQCEEDVEFRLTVSASLLRSAREVLVTDSTVKLLANHDDLLQRKTALKDLNEKPIIVEVNVLRLCVDSDVDDVDKELGELEEISVSALNDDDEESATEDNSVQIPEMIKLLDKKDQKKTCCIIS